jgi:hypothetical protein
MGLCDPFGRPVGSGAPISGNVFRRHGTRGDVWYAKYRVPDGRQVKRRIGPAWTERGRPAAGLFTKRTAEAWLADVLAEARRGELPGMVRTGATFADAAAEYMRWLEHDRDRKPSTLRDYLSILKAHLLPAFADRRLEDITTDHARAQGSASSGRRASLGSSAGRVWLSRAAAAGSRAGCRRWSPRAGGRPRWWRC